MGISTTTNVGIDFSILNDRLSGSVDYFYKKTTDVLFEQNLFNQHQVERSGSIWMDMFSIKVLK